MSFCPNCGNEIPENTRFCTVCGKPLQAQTPQPQPQPVAYRQSPQPQPPYTPNSQKSLPADLQRVTMIVTLCRAVLMVAAVLFGFIGCWKLIGWLNSKPTDGQAFDWTALEKLEYFLTQAEDVRSFSKTFIGLFIVTFALGSILTAYTPYLLERYAAKRIHETPFYLEEIKNNPPFSSRAINQLATMTTCFANEAFPAQKRKNVLLAHIGVGLSIIAFILFFVGASSLINTVIDSAVTGVEDPAYSWGALIVGLLFLIGDLIVTIIVDKSKSNARKAWYINTFGMPNG